jgi:alpha-N-acetylglucosaminidase
VSVVDSLLAAVPASRTADGYQYDLVNLTRQALGNATYIVGKRLLTAAAAKDLPAFRRESKRLLELGEDLDTLLGTRHEWLLGRWLADARGWAANPTEADYYEHNAREIITTWHEPGGGLSDYARRQWNGLFRTYYMDRWREFIQRLDQSLADGKPFDAAAYQKARVEGDGRWVTITGSGFLTRPTGDPYATAARLMAKYRPDLVVPEAQAEPVSEVTLATPAWSPAAFTADGMHRWTLDASALIRDAGPHLVTFRYRAGSSALTIHKVSVMQDGHELATDAHDGSTGHQHKDNTYQLKVSGLQPGKPVTLVMEVEPTSSNDTSGDIEIRRGTPNTADP